MNRKTYSLAISIALLLIFAFMIFSFQVRKSEVAVVTTFGRPTRPLTEPGIYGRFPWPIQNVYKFDQRVQNFTNDKLTQGLTQDGFSLLTQIYVGWKITEVTNFFPRFAGNTDPIAEAERVLERTVGSARQGIIGKHPLPDFLSVTGGNKFAEIENEILERVRSEVKQQSLGLEIEFLGFKKVGLPEAVTQSVFDRMMAERQKLATRYDSEGVSEAQRIRSEAERKAAETLADAEGKATRIKGQAEAEAAKSLAVFQQKPELALFIFRLNALEGALKERSTLIFDQQTPPFDLFKGVSTNLFKK